MFRVGYQETKKRVLNEISTQVSYNALERIRTPGPWNRNPVLYPTELRAQKMRASNARNDYYKGNEFLIQAETKGCKSLANLICFLSCLIVISPLIISLKGGTLNGPGTVSTTID